MNAIDRAVENRQISELKPAERNPRTHSSQQIDQIVASIREFGFTNPVLVDEAGCIIAGHGRIEAAKRLGIDEVPTICLPGLTEAQRRAYAIADNKLAENAGWDEKLLAIEFESITELAVDYDLRLTGFELPEIDLLISNAASEDCDHADEIPTVDTESTAVSQPGDLWFLGRHRLLCADATHRANFEQLLGQQRAQMVFTDPPYNVPIAGHVSGLGSIQHREFAMASGEMAEEEFIGFLKSALGNLAAFSIDGSIHFVCIDWRHLMELTAVGRAVYSEQKNLCVWNKNNGGMGSLYRSKHELILVFKYGKNRHINNVKLGSNGRYRTNVWDYAGVNSIGEDRLEELAMHPTVKPVALVADAILDCSEWRGIVLDCFGGSGTTLIAAEQTGRRGFLMELDPLYVDVICRRYEQVTGKQATHAAKGLTFAQLAEERGNNATANDDETDTEAHHD